MNCAVIVDERYISSEVIRNHMQFLPNWCLAIATRFPLPSSAYDFGVRRLECPILGSTSAYNRLLTSAAFWRELVQYERVLIFQQDSGILREGIEEFLEWDYVGAPWPKNTFWAHPERKGGNGGLSLRNPRQALRLCEVLPYQKSFGNEDGYFTLHLESIGAQVAPFEVCKRFCCETEFRLRTFGYHAIDKHLSAQEVALIKSQFRNNSMHHRLAVAIRSSQYRITSLFNSRRSS